MAKPKSPALRQPRPPTLLFSSLHFYHAAEERPRCRRRGSWPFCVPPLPNRHEPSFLLSTRGCAGAQSGRCRRSDQPDTRRGEGKPELTSHPPTPGTPRRAPSRRRGIPEGIRPASRIRQLRRRESIERLRILSFSSPLLLKQRRAELFARASEPCCARTLPSVCGPTKSGGEHCLKSRSSEARDETSCAAKQR